MTDSDQLEFPPVVLPPGEEVRTFLIADIRGYTAFTQEHGDEAAARLTSVFAAVAQETAAEFGGQVIELRGDEALAVFRSPRSALRAANALQLRCAEIAASEPMLPLHIGIGLDAGEAVRVGDGFRSGAINLAARLSSEAVAGETLVSEGLMHLARKVEGLTYSNRGPTRIRGLDRPVDVYALTEEADGDLPARRRSGPVEKGAPPQPTMITGLVGASFATVGTMADVLVSTHGLTVAVAFGFLFSLLAFGGAASSQRNPDRGSLLCIAAAIGVILAVGWGAVIGAILLLISAGMGIARARQQ